MEEVGDSSNSWTFENFLKLVNYTCPYETKRPTNTLSSLLIRQRCDLRKWNTRCVTKIKFSNIENFAFEFVSKSDILLFILFGWFPCISLYQVFICRPYITG